MWWKEDVHQFVPKRCFLFGKGMVTTLSLLQSNGVSIWVSPLTCVPALVCGECGEYLWPARCSWSLLNGSRNWVHKIIELSTELSVPGSAQSKCCLCGWCSAGTARLFHSGWTQPSAICCFPKALLQMHLEMAAAQPWACWVHTWLAALHQFLLKQQHVLVMLQCSESLVKLDPAHYTWWLQKWGGRAVPAVKGT